MNVTVMQRTARSGPIQSKTSKFSEIRTTPRAKAALLVLVAAGLMTIGLRRVHQRHQVVRVGYELSEARAELRKLAEEQNRLRLEESVLTSPGRIERIAESLGMVRPSPNQLRIIPPKNSVALRK